MDRYNPKLLLLIAVLAVAGCLGQGPIRTAHHATPVIMAPATVIATGWTNPNAALTDGDATYASTSTRDIYVALGFTATTFTGTITQVTFKFDQQQTPHVDDKWTPWVFESTCGTITMSNPAPLATLSRSIITSTATCPAGWTWARVAAAYAGASTTRGGTTNDGEWRFYYGWLEVTFTNNVPVANAGSDLSRTEGTLVTLDGTASSDLDGARDPLAYSWLQTGGTSVTLTGATTATPTFTAPLIPTNTAVPLTFQLTVTDPNQDSSVDTVVVNVQNVNGPPVANAGPDQSVNEATAVTLDGTSSSDPDLDALTYTWSQTVGPAVTLDTATPSRPTFTAPNVPTPTPVTLTFQLVVRDGTVDSTADLVTVTLQNVNAAPVSNAGPDQSVNELVAVTLDGSSSTDPDTDSITYTWTQTAGPAVTLNTAVPARPTFTAPTVPTQTPLSLTFSLVVRDGTLNSPADLVVITVANVNAAPIANAGPDQNANEGAAVTLDGTLSSDPDTDAVTYTWTQTVGPAVTLGGATTANPTFTAPAVATQSPVALTFQLVVRDAALNSAPDLITVLVQNVNQAPSANAGPDQSVNEGVLVTLAGAGTDPDADATTYSWTQTSGPAVTLLGATTANPTFTAPSRPTNSPATLDFSLIVNDGQLPSAADVVRVTVNNVNQAPTSSAGPDQSVDEAATVTLDATLSTDPDSDPLTYAWSQTAGPAVALSSAAASRPTFTAPALSNNNPVQLTFSLTVNDGFVSSSSDTVQVTVQNINQPPLAQAGADQTVNEQTGVTLDGTASNDQDADAITYLWSQTSGPAVTLGGATTNQPTFTAPTLPTNVNVQLVFQLIVRDGAVDSAPDTVQITVRNVNQAPAANAGPDQTVIEGAAVTLDGTGSSDPDLDAVGFAWTQSSGPSVTLAGATTNRPTFAAPTLPTNAAATLIFSLVANDGQLPSPADTVQVTVQNVNQAPVANAGPDQSRNESTLVTLDGTLSSDSDADPLTFTWTQTAGPAAALSGATTNRPTFTAPAVPTNTPVVLTFRLVVRDGIVDSAADTIQVTVANVNQAPLSNAGADQSVDEAAAVTLDATSSTDADADPLTFAWTQASGPAVTLTGPTNNRPTFTAPATPTNTPLILVFSLTVHDGAVAGAADTVTITIRNINQAPTASAGADQNVNEATPVELVASGADADGDVLSYSWTQTSGPAQAVSGASTNRLAFTAPAVPTNAPVTLRFQVAVSDGLAGAVLDTVDVVVQNVNQAPVADAGPDRTVDENATVTIAGAATDADSDPVTVAWTQTAGPSVTLVNGTSATPRFQAPLLASNSLVNLTFRLVANDGTVPSAADTVQISVRNLNGAPVASPGASQIVSIGVAVVLDGNQSSDPDGDAITYLWNQTSGPAVALSSPAAARPTFTAPGSAGTLVFSLVVRDGPGLASVPQSTVVTVQATGTGGGTVTVTTTVVVPPSTTAAASTTGTPPATPRPGRAVASPASIIVAPGGAVTIQILGVDAAGGIVDLPAGSCSWEPRFSGGTLEGAATACRRSYHAGITPGLGFYVEGTASVASGTSSHVIPVLIAYPAKTVTPDAGAMGECQADVPSFQADQSFPVTFPAACSVDLVLLSPHVGSPAPARLEARLLSAAPPAPDGLGTPAGLVVELTLIGSDDQHIATGASIQFLLTRAWLEAECPPARCEVVLYHVTADGWEKLDTDLLQAEPEYSRYVAVTDSFSTFVAAGSLKGIAAPVPTGPGASAANPYLPWILGLCIGAAIVGGSVVYVRRRRDARSAPRNSLADLVRDARRDDVIQFVNAAAHDLASPLSTLNLELHLLLEADPERLTPAQQRSFAAMGRSIDQLKLLVRDLKDASRMGAGRFQLFPAPTDIGRLLRDVADPYSRRGSPGLTTKVPDGLGGSIDAPRIVQVVTNLLDNAFKFTPAGGAVSLEARPEPDGVHLLVRDSGIGLSPVQVAQLFRPFVQVHGPEQRRLGTGLGLYISKGIVEGHGGRIWVESAGLGRGSTFHVWLPASARRATAA